MKILNKERLLNENLVDVSDEYTFDNHLETKHNADHYILAVLKVKEAGMEHSLRLQPVLKARHVDGAW